MNYASKPHERRSEPQEHRKRSRFIWLCAFCTAVVIFGLVIASYFLRNASDRVRFLTESVLSASVLGVIAIQAWIYNEQRKAARISERGYIGVDTADLVDFEEGKVPYIKVRFLNGGRTPVWHFQAPAALKVGTEPPLASLDIPGPQSRRGEGFLPAGSGTSTKYLFRDVATDRLIRRIVSGNRTIYLWGVAYFQDCWGEARTYSFRLVYNPTERRFEEYDQITATRN